MKPSEQQTTTTAGADDTPLRRPSIRRSVVKLTATVIFMFAFGFALVPLYDVFCDITGLNGKTGRVSAASLDENGVDRSRLITVQFIASVNNSSPWEFRPVAAQMQVHPGEIYETNYFARNKTAAGLTGQAVPSVSPTVASLYFNKTECFCFTKQHFEAGEGRDMPVRFVIDTEIPANVESVTLSYTFFELS